MPDGQLETQGIRMGMTGQVIRPDWGQIEQGYRLARMQAHIAARQQPLCRGDRPPLLRIAMLRLPQTKPLGIGLQFDRRRGDAQGRIVEKTDFTVRMTHGAQPHQHLRHLPTPLRQLRRPRLAQRLRVTPGDIAQVEQVFQCQGVIHGAALEMTAIGQHLFR